MATSGWRRHKAKRDDIARLSMMMDEMKREFDSQKQELEQKISRLECELTRTQLEVQNKAICKEAEIEPITSRRRMLKRLGAAAAGLAVASVVTGVGQEAQIAQAGGTPLNVNDGATPLTPVVNLTAGLTTIKTSGTAGFQTLTLINDLTGTSTPNPATTYYPYDALVATSVNGVAVNAFSTSGSSAILGVQNSNSGINTDVAANVPAITTTGGITGSSDTAKGVIGLSRSGAGIFGFGSGDGGYGAIFQVASDGTASTNKIKGSAPLLIVPEPQIGQPNATGITHQKGEIHVDASGDVWVCTGLGTTGGIAMSQNQINKRFPSISASDQQRLLVGATPTFSKLGGGSSGSSTIVYLSNPIRIVGPNNTINKVFAPLSGGGNTPSYFMIEGTWDNANTVPVTGTIPPNAVSVIGTVAIVSPVANGFATLYPANAPSIPFVATINYRVGGATNNGFTCKLGAIPTGQTNAGKLGIAVVSSQVCTMALDIVAYVL
jgi:hypothetical protein